MDQNAAPRSFRKDRVCRYYFLLTLVLGGFLLGIAAMNFRVEVLGEAPRPALLNIIGNSSKRSFTIANDRFLKDGQEFRIFSGSIHYQRVHPNYWEDRLLRMRAMGLNCVTFYIPWNLHEEKEGAYDFEGSKNVFQFMALIQRLGMYAIVRPGPYIDAEWDFGGLPWWLLSRPKPFRLRTWDPTYIPLVGRWFDELLPRLQDHLYSNGGPILMVQLENEYGSYGNAKEKEDDRKYLEFLLTKLQHHLGHDVIIFTTDGFPRDFIDRGTLPEKVLALSDFGPGSDWAAAFKTQKEVNPKGKSPAMCTEYYSGWLSHWGEKMALLSTFALVHTLDGMLSAGASFSLYMAHGGTNFGFWDGANRGLNGIYQPVITSYDYNCPIAEGGGHNRGIEGTDKFLAMQELLRRHGAEEREEPPLPTSVAYEERKMTEGVKLFDALDTLAERVIDSDGMEYMEKHDQGYGLILYRTALTAGKRGSKAFTLSLRSPPRDHGMFYVGRKKAGEIYRGDPEAANRTITVQPVPESEEELQILVENLGRMCFGWALWDPKGIEGELLVDGEAHRGDWKTFTLPLSPSQISGLPLSPVKAFAGNEPWFLQAKLHIKDDQDLKDTYIHPYNFSRGHIWVNGVHIGRYWVKMRTQQTLYVPKYLLRQGENLFLFLELEQVPSEPRLSFSASPVFDYPSAQLGTSAIAIE